MINSKKLTCHHYTPAAVVRRFQRTSGILIDALRFRRQRKLTIAPGAPTLANTRRIVAWLFVKASRRPGHQHRESAHDFRRAHRCQRDEGKIVVRRQLALLDNFHDQGACPTSRLRRPQYVEADPPGTPSSYPGRQCGAGGRRRLQAGRLRRNFSPRTCRAPAQMSGVSTRKSCPLLWGMAY